jgi:trehalose 6-phosphate synthase/phosphatase
MKAPGSYKELTALTILNIKRSVQRLFLLDFDGTLVDISDDVSSAVPSEDILNLLDKLTVIPGNHLVIITGRSRDTIDHLFESDKIDIVAEHGAMIREKGSWKDLTSTDTAWKDAIIRIFEKFSSLLPGSVIENKSFSVAWHYRNADKRNAIKVSGTLIRELGESVKKSGLTLIDGKKVVEIISNKINKGIAAAYLTEKNNYDFILSIGDDTTDEDMFRLLGNRPGVFTVRIGNPDTLANFTLENVGQVKRLLGRLIDVCDS